MNYASTFILYAEDLQALQTILIDALEFTMTAQGKGFSVLENGALRIRLVHNSDKAGQLLNLEISSTDIEVAIKFYQQYGFIQTGDLHWVHCAREEVTMQAELPICLVISRDYNEDELGIMPELQTSLEWHKDALLITQRLVKTIPINFRDIARGKIISMAEADTIVVGQIEVNQQRAIDAIIKVTPNFQHEALKDEIIKNGLLVNDYFPDE